MRLCIGINALQLTNVTNFDTLRSPKWPTKKSLYVTFFILTPGFPGPLCSLVTLNMPCRASLLSEKKELANLTKKVEVLGSSTFRNTDNTYAHPTTARKGFNQDHSIFPTGLPHDYASGQVRSLI